MNKIGIIIFYYCKISANLPVVTVPIPLTQWPAKYIRVKTTLLLTEEFPLVS